MKNIRYSAFLAIAAAIITFGSVFASPALAGNTFWDSSTTEWLSGGAHDSRAAIGAVPCDPAAAKKGGLSFLP